MSEPAALVTQQTRDPWERLGWVMGAVWVVFLYFPISSAATADTAPVWRAAGVALIVAFGLTYLVGLRRTSHMDSWAQVVRTGWTHLAVMVGLQLLSALVIGVGAVYLLPYVVSLATFTLPLRTAAVVSGTGVAASALVPLATGNLQELGAFAIVTLVAVLTMVIRVVNQRQMEHLELAEELALVEERERVARDVHDVLGHNLTVVTVKAELAERLIDVDPERARAELAEIRSLTREALAEIRATVAGLRVARLADELVAARTALVGAGIAADLPDDPDLVDPRHRIVIAWVLREAVTNVVRHSGAARCTVELGPGLLRITDDGQGVGRLPEGGIRGGGGTFEGNGLRGVRERVAAAGGTLAVVPGPGGRGTTVEVRL